MTATVCACSAEVRKGNERGSLNWQALGAYSTSKSRLTPNEVTIYIPHSRISPHTVQETPALFQTSYSCRNAAMPSMAGPTHVPAGQMQLKLTAPTVTSTTITAAITNRVFLHCFLACSSSPHTSCCDQHTHNLSSSSSSSSSKAAVVWRLTTPLAAVGSTLVAAAAATTCSSTASSAAVVTTTTTATTTMAGGQPRPNRRHLLRHGLSR